MNFKLWSSWVLGLCIYPEYFSFFGHLFQFILSWKFQLSYWSFCAFDFYCLLSKQCHQQNQDLPEIWACQKDIIECQRKKKEKTKCFPLYLKISKKEEGWRVVLQNIDIRNFDYINLIYYYSMEQYSTVHLVAAAIMVPTDRQTPATQG